MPNCKKCGGDRFVKWVRLRGVEEQICTRCAQRLETPKVQSTEKAEMALARETAALCADLFMLAGTHIGAPLPELEVIAKGTQVQIGLCGAAVALRELLKRDELGSVALRDLVHKPSFHDVQGK